jgi:hypothetical protein
LNIGKNMTKKFILTDEGAVYSRVYAIICMKPFVEIAFDIRKSLQLPITRSIDDLSWNIDSETVSIPFYHFFQVETESEFKLYKNRAYGLEPAHKAAAQTSLWDSSPPKSIFQVSDKHKSVDAFLVETNFDAYFQLNAYKIAKSKSIDFCFEVNSDQLSASTHLLLGLQ